MDQSSFKEFESQYDSQVNQVLFAKLAADLDTPVTALLKLTRAEKYSFLLESVTGGEELGRYSIIGLEPDLIWQCRGETACINWMDGFEPDCRLPQQSNDPFGSLRNLIQASRIDLPEDLPASSAGLFGFLAYDMIRLVEHLPHVNPDPLGTPDALLVRPSVVAVLDGVEGEVTLVTPVWHNAKISAQRAYELGQARLRSAKKRLEQPFNYSATRIKRTPLQNFQHEVTREAYMQMVEKAKDFIRAGDIIQMVPSQRWSLEFDYQPFAFYRALRKTNPSPFMFFFNFNGFHVIGASPEILVRVADRQVTIRPIAGTRPRGRSKEEDQALADELLADEKERAEHLMLLDLGRNDVGRVVKVGTVNPNEQFVIERYSHVMHIVSNVVGELSEDEDALSALMAGLPAGTVSGAPKIRAMEIIDELEKTKRGIYAGGVGYFSSNGEMDMCIALRTAVIKDQTLYVQAGGGVVFDSDPASEWQETVNKSMALRKAAENTYRYVLEPIKTDN